MKKYLFLQIGEKMSLEDMLESGSVKTLRGNPLTVTTTTIEGGKKGRLLP